MKSENTVDLGQTSPLKFPFQRPPAQRSSFPFFLPNFSKLFGTRPFSSHSRALACSCLWCCGAGSEASWCPMAWAQRRQRLGMQAGNGGWLSPSHNTLDFIGSDFLTAHSQEVPGVALSWGLRWYLDCRRKLHQSLYFQLERGHSVLSEAGYACQDLGYSIH